MADNTTLDSGSGGDAIVTREISHAGDTAKLQGLFLMGIAGTEGSYTAAAIDGDATNGIDVDVTRVGGTVAVSHAALTELAAAIDTEVQCDIVGALPAGTNNIGDVDVLTLPSTVHSADFDTGGGTDTTLAFGIAVPASGGAAVVPGDATAGLKVDLGADNDVTVTGSVTANAGTNLNTSALALESGGNLADVKTAVQIIDDWDESDRAKVNPIAGQAGVAAGAGNVSALTQRVTLAGDDPGVALLGTIDVDTGNIATSVGVMDDWDNGASDGASVSGDVAHDTADAGEPVKAGAKASTALSGLTLVANADRSNLFCGVDGVLYVRNYCLEDVVQERTTNTDGASTAFASGLASPGAGVRLWIKSVDISNSSASFCTVDLRDGAAGSVLWTLPVPATGGVVKTFDPPLRLTADTALAFDASAATSTLSISANGFKSKV